MCLREAARHVGISGDSLRKMSGCSVPPGQRRRAPFTGSKLDGFTEIIRARLEEDRGGARTQRHIARRVFERLRKEHGCTGGDTIVKDCLREHDRSGHEMFVPLAHAPGMPRPTSRRRCASSMASSRRRFPLPSIFRTAMPVPSGPILRRHPRPAATGMFTQSTAAVVCRSHDLPCNRHGRPGKGNEKGSAERLAGYDRRNVLGPVARFPSWTAVDASLEAQCRKQASGRRSARPQREDRRGPCPGSRGNGGAVASPL